MTRAEPETRPLDVIARRVHEHFLADEAELDADDTAELRRQIEATGPLLDRSEVDAVALQVAQRLFGLGALEPLLADDAVTELMVNGPGKVWVERYGQVEPTAVVVDAAALRIIVERIIAPLGLRVDRTAPFVDARLPDGSRVNIAVAPLAVDGPYVTIRRFGRRPFELTDFCSTEIARVIRDAIHARRSMIVSGGTGSGKTSLLNAIAAQIDPWERVITIEDAAELRLPGEHTVRLEARPPNAEGVGEVTIRSLVRNALRMRPDRIVIGEVRGAEALDMIQAMNTGHDGSLATCHANSPLDALRRIEAMALMAGVGLPARVMREHLRAAVNLIVQVERSTEGARSVQSIYRCGDDATWLVREGRLCGR